MLVDEKHIIEEVAVDEAELYDDIPGTHIRYNHTDPNVIRDGIDAVAVIKESEDIYRIDFRGFAFGRLRVTPEGVEQLGQDLLGDPDTVPDWTVEPDSVDADDLPWWVPEETRLSPTVSCGVCTEEVSVRDVVTPQRSLPGTDAAILCRDCWEGHSD